jgi:hypothetical protein
MSDCGCSNNNVQVYQNTATPCTYTKEQIEAWKSLIICVRDNELLNQAGISTHDINVMMGIILSALRIDDPCYLKTNLDSIYNKIVEINSYNIC